VDLPGQHIFEVAAGDIILFNEALLHNGRPNPSKRLRKTIIMNLGRADAGVWKGYTPMERTLNAVTPRQRAILTNAAPVWAEPVLV
jgi:ectoine hydroxylase-related dioxygenase (phytanoyl-CoA dioxygenase family)